MPETVMPRSMASPLDVLTYDEQRADVSDVQAEVVHRRYDKVDEGVWFTFEKLRPVTVTRPNDVITVLRGREKLTSGAKRSKEEIATRSA